MSIFRCVECDETRDSDWEDGTVLGADGLICTACVEAATCPICDGPMYPTEDGLQLFCEPCRSTIDMADMIYAHAQEATL